MDAMEDYRLYMILGYAKQQKAELEELKARTRAALERYYMPVTVEEVLRTRFAYLERLNGELLELMSRTREM